MPKLSPGASNPYGNSNINNSMTFRERLMERFQAHEYVRVMNIDTEPIRWQYLPSHSEEHTFTADPMKITHRGDVEVYMLNPGESEVLLGENAYLMIDNLYKQIAAKRAIEKSPDIAPGQARNFNFSDAQKQEELIDRILIGKEMPNFGSYEVVKEPELKPEKAADPKVKNERERELRKHLSEQVA